MFLAAGVRTLAPVAKTRTVFFGANGRDGATTLKMFFCATEQPRWCKRTSDVNTRNTFFGTVTLGGVGCGGWGGGWGWVCGWVWGTARARASQDK